MKYNIMKAKFIYEILNFDRTGTSLKKMKIGKISNEKFIKETDWQLPYLEQFKIINLIRNYNGFPILVLKLEDIETELYQPTSTFDYSNLCKTPSKAIEAMKKRINNYKKKFGLSERLEFNREGSSIEKIGIRQKEIDRQIIKNTEWNWDINSVPLLFPNVEKIKFIRNYKGLPILILKDTSSENKPYIGMSIKGFGGEPSKTIEEAEKSIKSVINWKSLS